MFLSETHLPQLLPTSAYSDRDWFERELTKIFLPSWHVLATKHEIRRPGDFITKTILGYPVILFNADNEPRCFINSCAHRFAKLTSKSRGNQCRLKCQYHGWEYDDNGVTKRIPDAPGFRPLEKNQLSLLKLDVETCGGLIFVRLKQTSQSLSESLGELHAVVQQSCSDHFYQLCSWERDVRANWKIVVENTLESYHVSEIHGSTLGDMPDESVCQHKFTKNSSSFVAPGGLPGLTGAVHHRVLRSLGIEPSGLYQHHFAVPGFSVSVMGVRETRLTLRAFSVQSPRRAVARNSFLLLCAWNHLRFWSRVWNEDVRLYPDVQSGLEAPLRPGRGLLSRREERVYHLQQYIYECLNGADRPIGSEI
jgi:choline monooxygenase